MKTTGKVLIGAAVLLGGLAAVGAAKAAPSSGGQPPGGDAPKPGDAPGGSPPPAGGGGAKPPTTGPKPGGSDQPTIWVPDPYDQYEFGTYTIDLTALGNGVRWRVWETKMAPSSEAERDAFKLGAGLRDTEDEARVAAEAFVNSLTKAKSQPLPPKPTPDAAAAPEVIERHGVRIRDDGRVLVTDRAAWIAWAEPYLRSQAKTTDGTALARALFAASFPELGEAPDLGTLWVETGTTPAPTVLELLSTVDAKYFAPERRGEAWLSTSQDEPRRFDRAAAELVGVQAPSSIGRSWAFKGYQVEVERGGSGWVWRAWRRGRSNDAPPDLRGVAVVQRRANRAAKAAIEQVA